MEWAVSMKAQLAAAKYDLVANICHDSSGAQVCIGCKEKNRKFIPAYVYHMASISVII